jgi:hypothetical protein
VRAKKTGGRTRTRTWDPLIKSPGGHADSARSFLKPDAKARVAPQSITADFQTVPAVIGKNDVAKLAKAAHRKLARINDPKKLKRLAENLADFQRVVASVGHDREQINEIADPLIETQVKCGRALALMAERKERHSGRGDQKSALRRVTPIPKLSDLGFTGPRATRWMIAGKLPDELRQEYKAATLAQPDGILTLAGVVKAGKLWLGTKQRADKVKATKAEITLAAWEQWLPKQDPCDALLTDPPYSTDIEDIDAFARSWLPVALGKVKSTGRAYVCIGAYPAELRAYLSVPPPPHLLLSQVLVWTYRNRVGPSPTDDYKLNWQAILYYRGVEAPPLNCARAVSEYPKLEEQFSVQDINLPDPRRHESWHAWQKPDELCERFVRHSTKPGDLILDPFAGTGSFILAAARLGRIARGCDNDKAMVMIALERGCSGT